MCRGSDSRPKITQSHSFMMNKEQRELTEKEKKFSKKLRPALDHFI
jgi:hypothetical protein